MKELILKAYKEEIERVDSEIESLKKEIESTSEEIKEKEEEKVKLGMECTRTLKQLEEQGSVPGSSFALNVQDSISLTPEDCKRANEWVKTHELLHHTSNFLGLTSKYCGCTPVADYELREGWTGLGRYVSLVCTKCERNQVKDCYFDIEEIG